ncbi:MAG TPA: SDR family oxidoreductase, partial [Bryobacteraceae bacterium]|nr:SDR family oxidoreductase [Bryobacteraceae bacterium]
MLAVITGASSGIGATFARKLAARGFDLLLIARREDRLRSLAGEVSSLYRIQAEASPADLTDDAQRGRIADRIHRAPDLGLLVNNAGFGTNGYFAEADLRGQEAMHRLHVLNTVALTHAALGNLLPRAQPGTGIINVSSVAGFGISPQSVSYCATKAWMNAFTEGLALELANKNSPVKVQALCPGLTLTEFHDVLGMDRSKMPQSLWMTPDYVVEESLRGFDRGDLFVIPGWRYKA